MNRDIGGPTDLNSHRSSSSHISHTSTPANVWPPPTAIGKCRTCRIIFITSLPHIFLCVGGSNDQSVDGVSAENLMDMGPQTTAIENGFNGNWWTYPPPPLNQIQHGKRCAYLIEEIKRCYTVI